ncbi:MAG: UDP-N-acetylmuramoyl-L-alanyl-D-glutamate--2,6-diaminopimelate ligase [Bacteroidales bacterium]|nr:UDP-N-acetylmuramoyl-L-alanyl-D-glutamate--2,6-diaminopimelate ligase [Bacteroidales bacterium]HNW72790.1 UDP-N-acetylmuramoyl-L-alanyl-D-glutamate--2,6-diaminopimelate ligase [Bacteroidales bacterium]HPS49425.1 UDP-N-acetylmuramoyl-L-alanyl-D-glutamate--2,6-diaminopimelate ligase [Bacteroidales bacterium]
MQLRDLIKDLETLAITGSTDNMICKVQSDSRMVGPDDLFIATSGTRFDGHDFINKALDQGAVAIICETLPAVLREKTCYIQVKSSAHTLGVVASAFYGNPSEKLLLIGVTGTNGKTTTATLLYELFKSLGYRSGLISTIVNRIHDTSVPASHTTPDPLSLNELLSRMVDDGCDYCFMEVSSHAIDQQRIAGLVFKGGIFTNLTHDHLDYHKTFDSYLKAKKAFFDRLPSGSFALVNKDDRNGYVMTQNTRATVYAYSLQSMADFHSKILENQFQGLQLLLDGKEVWFRLVGRFNAYNLLAVYATAALLDQDRTEVLTCLSNLNPVDGRFNYLVSSRQVTAIVDYAHTPDALKNVLETINEIRAHNEMLITVVGAGGNRDTTKRPIMARIACTLSDRVILTSDNPRNEDPRIILDQMKEGVEMHQSFKVLTIENRREAIRAAYALARPGDIILVAGKGHETYQEIQGVRHHFDDREVIEEAFRSVDIVNQ